MGADSNKLTYVPRNTYILIKDLSTELQRSISRKTIGWAAKETKMLYVFSPEIEFIVKTCAVDHF